MTKKSSPYDPFGLTKMLSAFDPMQMMNEFAKTFGGAQAAGVDMTAILESQRKNVEALTSANQRALAGVQAVVEREREILRQTLDGAGAVLAEVSAATSPQEAVAKQTELLKTAFEKALTNMRELAEQMTKANTEAVDVINKRVSEGLEEIKTLALKAKK